MPHLTVPKHKGLREELTQGYGILEIVVGLSGNFLAASKDRHGPSLLDRTGPVPVAVAHSHRKQCLRGWVQDIPELRQTASFVEAWRKLACLATAWQSRQSRDHNNWNPILTDLVNMSPRLRQDTDSCKQPPQSCRCWGAFHASFAERPLHLKHLTAI